MEIYKLKIMSFNVRYKNIGDSGGRSWTNRRAAVLKMFADQKPDIVGIQEAMWAQKAYLDQNLSAYKSIGVGRNNGANSGEFIVIYYLEKIVKLESWGTFWLSETPSTPSRGWDASLFRTATYATFTHIESGKKFFVINTHLDDSGTVARTKSMELLGIKMKTLNMDINDYPMILIGDFNMTIDDNNFNGISFMGNARMDSLQTDYWNSFNGWGSGGRIIDHIFFRRITPLKFMTIVQPYLDIIYLSDHYPIVAEFQIK